jgi:murein endopeptidase
MDRLNGSVGRGGRNDHADVLMVQKKLNKNLHLMGTTIPVPEDGNVDAKTQEAIITFQRVAMRITTPDGRVDPNGRTWSMLTGAQGQTTPSFIQLPGDGLEYYIYTQTSKVYGTPATILSIKSLATRVKAALGIRIAVGDISFQNGGHMAPHDSHTRGVDVDIRPLRNDGIEGRVTFKETTYSRENTRKLVELVHEDTNLKSILFNDTKITGVKQWAGHDNHLHIRFKS